MLFSFFFSQNWTKRPGQDLEVGIRNADLKFKTQALAGTLFCSQFITSYHGCLLVLLHFHKIIVLAFHFFSRIFKALQADCRQVPANNGVHTMFILGRVEEQNTSISKNRRLVVLLSISLYVIELLIYFLNKTQKYRNT